MHVTFVMIRCHQARQSVTAIFLSEKHRLDNDHRLCNPNMVCLMCMFTCTVVPNLPNCCTTYLRFPPFEFDSENFSHFHDVVEQPWLCDESSIVVADDLLVMSGATKQASGSTYWPFTRGHPESAGA